MKRVPSRLLFLILLSFFGSAQLFAQNYEQAITNLKLYGSSTFDFRNRNLMLKDIMGSPYLAEEFSEGRILMGRNTYEGLQLRYNIYNDRFEVRLEQNTIELDPVKTPIDTLYYAGTKFVLKFMQPEKNKDLSHMAVLYNHTDCNLLKKYEIELNPETKPGAYKEAKQAEFDSKPPDYYLGRGEDLYLLKGIKTIAEFFKVEAKEVKSYMRSDQLKIKNEEDLVRICAHFVSLPSARN